MVKKKQQRKPGTRAGVSETIVEMAAEHADPAMWAALQITKPGQPPAQTVGEILEQIRDIMASALDKAMAERWRRLHVRLVASAVMYEQLHATASDPKHKRLRRIQANTMREALGIARDEAQS